MIRLPSLFPQDSDNSRQISSCARKVVTQSKYSYQVPRALLVGPFFCSLAIGAIEMPTPGFGDLAGILGFSKNGSLYFE